MCLGRPARPRCITTPRRRLVADSACTPKRSRTRSQAPLSVSRHRSSGMSGTVTLDALDLAALLCSRVCHDLISPTGAIVNGLEVLEEAKRRGDQGRSRSISSRRAPRPRRPACSSAGIAFGAAGSAGAQIDTGDAETMARGFHRGRQDQADLEPAARAACRRTASSCC